MAWDEATKIIAAVSKNNCLTFRGTCDSNMTGSTTEIVSKQLRDFGDDFFNGGRWYIQILKNYDSVGSAPDGEYRKITDYDSNTGTFTVEAFSANVEALDKFRIVDELMMAILTNKIIIGDYILADKSDFGTADADADTTRWDPEYITGSEGGSADINTTVANHLMVKTDPDSSPAEARYAVSHNIPYYADFFIQTIDLDLTWGATDSATAKAAGVLISKGSAYDSQNYIAIERQKGTSINRIQVRYNLNNAGEATVNVAVTDDSLAFKVERWDQTWNLYYSLSQYPNYDWKLAAEVEDPSNYMSNQFTMYLQTYSKGTADAESVEADFAYYRYYVGAGGGSQFIAGDYDSTWVTADDDGTVFERLEDIRAGLFPTGGANWSVQINNATATTNFETSWEGLMTWIGIDGTNQLSKISNVTPTTLNAAIQSLASTIGIDAANTFSSTVQGSARTTIEGVSDGLAAYFSPAGAAWSVAINNGAATLNLETSIEALETWIGIGGTSQLSKLSNVTPVTLDAAIQSIAATIGIDGSNTFSSTIQGAARTTLEGVGDGIAAYFSPAGAAWSVQMNNAVAVSNVETTWEGLLTWIGIDGVNQLSKISNVTPTTLNAAIQAIAAPIGVDGANLFSTTQQGAAKTTIDTAFDGIASYITAAGAAYSVTMNNAAAVTTIETTFEGLFTWIGIDGTNQLSKLSNVTPTTLNAAIQSLAATIGIDGTNVFSSTIQGAARTTIESAFDGVAAYFVASGAAYSVTINGGAVTTLATLDQAVAADIEHLYALADGGTNPYPDSVAQESIFAYIMSKSTDPVKTSYNNTTDSLEAISDAISTGTLQIEAEATTTTTRIVASEITQADDYWNGCLLLSINGQNSGQARPIVDSDLSSTYVDVYPAFANTPDVGDDFLIISAWKAHEWDQKPDVAGTVNAILASETDIFDLTVAGMSYKVGSLRLKCADPGAQTVTVRLYELVNDVEVLVDTFTITTDNYTTYFSLMDMFGMHHLQGDNLRIAVIATDAGPYAVTFQYSYAECHT